MVIRLSFPNSNSCKFNHPLPSAMATPPGCPVQSAAAPKEPISLRRGAEKRREVQGHGFTQIHTDRCKSVIVFLRPWPFRPVKIPSLPQRNTGLRIVNKKNLTKKTKHKYGGVVVDQLHLRVHFPNQIRRERAGAPQTTSWIGEALFNERGPYGRSID